MGNLTTACRSAPNRSARARALWTSRAWRWPYMTVRACTGPRRAASARQVAESIPPERRTTLAARGRVVTMATHRG